MRWVARVLLAENWITRTGVVLVTFAAFGWLFSQILQRRGHEANPYAGLLAAILLPLLFFAGLALIPTGLVIAKRKGRDLLTGAGDRTKAWRKAILFLTGMTALNVIIGSQLSYRAIEHMETVQFCGQTCHVMKPEFTGHQRPPHQRVGCVECHVIPGAAGWIEAKTSGTRQLLAVILNNFPRPIASAMESNRLVPSAQTCEKCHDRAAIIGDRLHVHTKFQDDQANTRTETVLTMHVGGGPTGGIHGAHMGPGVSIRYAAADKRREKIPWIEYTSKGMKQAYFASDATPESIRALNTFEMQCVDCHNRPAHSFATLDRALDESLSLQKLPVDLPYIKKTAVALLSKPYQSDAEAAQGIRSGLSDFYRRDIPDVASTLLRIYQRNVFSDLRVTWGTYLNNLGHTDSAGCFRCHDADHTASGGKTIQQDCTTCHEALAVDESSPEILKTLGLRPEQPKGPSQ